MILMIINDHSVHIEEEADFHGLPHGLGGAPGPFGALPSGASELFGLVARAVQDLTRLVQGRPIGAPLRLDVFI